MVIEAIGEPVGQWTVRCRECLWLLRYAPIDVVYHTHRDYGGGSDDVGTIRCPKCDKRVVVAYL